MTDSGGCLEIDREYKSLSVVEAFRTIYSTKVWGDNGKPVLLGDGSHGPASEQYCDFLVRFIQDNNVQSVVDLGCGDFAVGKAICPRQLAYVISVSMQLQKLIDYHRMTVRDPHVTFMLADITNDLAAPI